MMSHFNLNLHTLNDFTKCSGIHHIYVKKLKNIISLGGISKSNANCKVLTLLCVLYQADNFFTDSRGTRFLNCFYTSEIGGSWKKQQNKQVLYKSTVLMVKVNKVSVLNDHSLQNILDRYLKRRLEFSQQKISHLMKKSLWIIQKVSLLPF